MDETIISLGFSVLFREYRKNWERLIKKTYEVDPLTCSKCSERMRILAFIDDEEVVKKNLKHLHLWDTKARPLLKRTNEPLVESHIEYLARPGSTTSYVRISPMHGCKTGFWL